MVLLYKDYSNHLKIYDITGIEEENKDIVAHIFPNPTAEQVWIQVNSKGIENLNYQLYDIQGKLLSENKFEIQTTISLKKLREGIYFLRLYSENKKIKTFKIIKTSN